MMSIALTMANLVDCSVVKVWDYNSKNFTLIIFIRSINMKLSITQPKSLAGNDYTKYYFKLVGLKFDCDTVKKAKKYYKGIYK